MTTAILDPCDAGITFARRSTCTKTDADVYAEIARAWCEMYPPHKRLKFSMQRYVVHPGFGREVWGRPEIVPREVIALCARVISVEAWRMTEVRLTGKSEKLTEGSDPLHAWWYPLVSGPEVGLHFWRLATGGAIELRSVATIDNAPKLECGRLAECNRRREEATLARMRRAGW